MGDPEELGALPRLGQDKEQSSSNLSPAKSSAFLGMTDVFV